MPIYNAIAAMSENRVIGERGHIPWRLPREYRWFKHRTMGGTLVMGRKTYESIGEPLPGRKTVVLSRSHSAIPGVEIRHGMDQLPAADSDDGTIWWVAGGTEIYQALLPQCHFLYLTRVKRQVSGDAFFPPFESMFEFDQLIHDCADFRVERWINQHRRDKHPVAPEAWPF
jgi:dihydrofolate reductase